MIKLGSLFDGIGGFPLSSVLCGIYPLWASEIEKVPVEITKMRFPNMKHLGDIKEINGAEVEPVDIISAGSPCQNLSVAGKRSGLGGEQSVLFLDFIRIVREMRESTNGVCPRYIIWENVPGAFSSNKGQDFRSVLEEISETKISMPKSGKWAKSGMVRGDGYSIAWRTLDAQYFGVPQRRKRIFLIADFRGQSAPEILFEPESMSRDSQEGREEGKEVTRDIRKGVNKTKSVYYESGQGWISEGVGCLRAEGENRPSRPTHTIVENMSYGLVSKGNGDAFLTKEKHMTLCCDGGQAGQGYPACLAISSKQQSLNISDDKANTLGANDYKEPQAVAFQPGNMGRDAGAKPNSEKFPTLGATTQGDQFPHIAIENHPNDSRVKIEEDGKVQTLTGRMGTGGGNVPIVMEPCYCLQGLMVGRKDENGSQGNGINKEVCFTLNTIDRHGVVCKKNKSYNITFCDANGVRKDRPDGGLYVNETDKANSLTTKSPSHETTVATYWDGGEKVGTLSARNAGGQQMMPDKQHFHGIVEKKDNTPYTATQYGKYEEGVGTLRASGGDLGGGSETLIDGEYAVRRLTPLECERLMGFPCNWSNIEGASDTARYKALGNSVAVPCVYYIMDRVVKYLRG